MPTSISRAIPRSRSSSSAQPQRRRRPTPRAVNARRQRWTREHESYVAGLRAEREKAQNGSGHRSALAAGCSRGGDARRHDLRGRDHHALPPAAPAPAADHAAELLPRLRRARPGHRHRARHQACRARAAGGAAHRRRVVSLQPHHPGARRLEAPRPADHDRHPQQQEIRGDAQGPRPSLSRWRLGQQRPALRRDHRRTRLRAAGEPFRLPRRARREAGRTQGSSPRPRWPPPRPGRPRSSTCT